MKKIFLILCCISICSGFAFADDADEYDSEYFYDSNGSGDQFLKISISAYIPLNFYDAEMQRYQLYTGGAATIGYFRFLNTWFALGGEVTPTFNRTIGSNNLTTIPILLGVLFQPSVWKFEFPIALMAGIAYETCQNKNYFPGFAAKADVGIFFRFSEMWSFGASCDFTVLPQWYKDPTLNDVGLFLAPGLSVRYHF